MFVFTDSCEYEKFKFLPCDCVSGECDIDVN